MGVSIHAGWGVVAGTDDTYLRGMPKMAGVRSSGDGGRESGRGNGSPCAGEVLAEEDMDECEPLW